MNNSTGTTAASLYALSLAQAQEAIQTVGHQRTVVLQGEMGTGKTSILKSLAKALPTHTPVYFDCNTKDLGDITIPHVMGIEDDSPFVRYVPNEELGLHLNDKPIILMIDEIGKALPPVFNALLCLMLERKMAGKPLHPDSIIFATTNLGAENVGDMFKAHQRNRLVFVNTRKPSVDEYLEYGINHEFDPALLSWVKDNPQLLQSFLEVSDPDENPYIFHPRAVGRDAFFSPRSGEAASDILKQRAGLDDTTLTALLMGTIGDRAARDLNAYVNLASQLPTLDQLKTTPESAPVPTSAAAVCMIVFRTLTLISTEWIDSWMIYLNRLDAEAQGLFARGVIEGNYSKRSLVMRNAGFTKWCMANNYMFAADKK